MRFFLAAGFLLAIALLDVPTYPASAVQAAYVVPAASPVFMGSGGPYVATVYLYAVNPSGWPVRLRLDFSSANVSASPRSMELNISSLSYQLVGVSVTVPSQPGSYELGYSWSSGGFSSNGSLQVDVLHVMEEGELIDVSMPYALNLQPGQDVQVPIYVEETQAKGTTSAGSTSYEEIDVPAGSPSEVLLKSIPLTVKEENQTLELYAWLPYRVASYSGDGLLLDAQTAQELLSSSYQRTSVGKVQFLLSSSRITSSTTDYFLLNLGGNATRFWFALNTHPLENFTLSGGLLSLDGGSRLLEGWTYFNGTILIAINSTAPLSWEVGEGGDKTGWLPPQSALGRVAAFLPVASLIAVVIVVAAALIYIGSHRKRGWPYSWDRGAIFIARGAVWTEAGHGLDRACLLSREVSCPASGEPSPSWWCPRCPSRNLRPFALW